MPVNESLNPNNTSQLTKTQKDTCSLFDIFMSPFSVTVQTNLEPPNKVQSEMIQSSLVQASVAAMHNPMGCDFKANGHCPLPRLSISSRSASVVASMDASTDGLAALHSVMKWKTVVAVFVVVVFYLVAGGLAFQALEKPFESNQKDSITLEKASFLLRHRCVTPAELEALIKVSGLRRGRSRRGGGEE